MVSCALSLAGSLLVMATFAVDSIIRSKRLRQLMLMLSLFDFMTAIGFTVSMAGKYTDENKLACQVLALFTMWAPAASFVATDVVSLFIFASIVYPSRQKWMNESHCLLWLGIGACVLIPFATVASVAAMSWEGYDPDFFSICWIKITSNPKEMFLRRMIGGKAIEWMSFVFVIACYVPTLVCVYRTNRSQIQSRPDSALQSNKRLLSPLLFRLICVPGMFILLRIPSTVLTINDYLKGPDVPLWHYLMAIGDPGQGAANGILFVVCSEHTAAILERLGCWRCACQKERTHTSVQTGPADGAPERGSLVEDSGELDLSGVGTVTTGTGGVRSYFSTGNPGLLLHSDDDAFLPKDTADHYLWI